MRARRRRSPGARASVRARSALACACALSALAQHARAEPSHVPVELGYNHQELETPRSAALNGAVRALGSSLEGLFLNPANMAASRVYHLGAIAQIWPESKRQSYGVGAVDSVGSSARLAGGLAGTYSVQDRDGVNRRWTDVRFALAYPLSDRFLLGVGGRYVSLRQDGVGPLGSSAASSGLPAHAIVRGVTFDAGATFMPAEGFHVAVVGTNLNNPDSGFQPLGVTGGIGYGSDTFGVEADVGADFSTWDQNKVLAMTGVEALLGNHFPLRAGYRFDEGLDSHSLSVGTGYVDRLFTLEIALRRTLNHDSATALIFGFTYHLEATGLAPSAADTF